MTLSTDVCVIGAGPAGGILAAVLAERGHDVIVLDAGPRFDPQDHVERMERALRPAFDRLDVWDMGGPRDAFTLSGGVPYELNQYRVKGIGGSTLHWRATAGRLHPEDFSMQTRHGLASDWPIGYEDIAPYYRQAERELGVAGTDHPLLPPRRTGFPQPAHPPSYKDELLRDAFSAVGAELHAPPRAINSEPYDGRSACEGYGTCIPVCPSGAKYSADVHVDRAEQLGATVLDRAPVQHLRHNDAGDRIVDATYVRDGEGNRVQADQFVLAAGGVESPRLLLRSASDTYPDGLANSSGRVGHYFTEHPLIGLIGRIDEPTGSDQIGFETSMSEAFYPHDRGPEGSMLLQVDNLTGQAPVSLLQRHANAFHLRQGDPRAVLQGDTFGDQLLADAREAYQHRVRLEAIVEQLPLEKNRVTLNENVTDDHGNAVPDIDYTIDDRTEATLERARSVLYEVMDEAGVYDVQPVASPSHPYFVSHHMGTTRMGEDPSESVVTPDLRTHDLENLYISSSGTFVTFGAAAPTLTIAALTLRLADHLDAQLGA